MGIENDTHIYCWLLAIGFLLGVMGVIGILGSLRRLGTFFDFLSDGVSCSASQKKPKNEF